MFQYTTIRTKILMLVLIFLLLMALIVILSILQLSKIKEQVVELDSRYENASKQALTFTIWISGLIILSGAIIGLLVTRSIVKRLTATVEVAKQLVNGNRDINIEFPYKDETGQLLEAMKQISFSIRNTENSLKRQTEELARTNESLKKEIAERKVTEEALRVSQQYTRNIINSSLDMIIAVDTERKITEFNNAAQRTFGYTPEEVLGKHVDMLYAEIQEAFEVYQDTVKTGKSVKTISNKRKNGEVFPCLLSASILYDANG